MVPLVITTMYFDGRGGGGGGVGGCPKPNKHTRISYNTFLAGGGTGYLQTYSRCPIMFLGWGSLYGGVCTEGGLGMAPGQWGRGGVIHLCGW